jgi:thioredoxin reductase (NADPH)
VIRENAIQDNVKYWVKPDIENRIKEGEIKAFFNSSLASVREYEADIITPSGVITLENDFVLAMTGYQPDFSFLVDMGIKLNMEDEICVPLHNPETMETNVPGIYLAGVICGGTQTNKWFIENSRIHADVVVDHIKMMKDHGPAGQVLQP